MFPDISHLSVDNQCASLTSSPFAPIPIEEIAKLGRLASLELAHVGVPLAALGRERGRTLKRLKLVSSLVSTEDLAICLDQLDSCESVGLKAARSSKRAHPPFPRP